MRARRAQAALRNGWAPPAGVPHRAGFDVQVPARRAPPGARRALRRGPLRRPRAGPSSARKIRPLAQRSDREHAARCMRCSTVSGGPRSPCTGLHGCSLRTRARGSQCDARRTHLRLVDEALVDVRDDAAARNGGLRAQRLLRRARPGTQGTTACAAVRAPRPSPPPNPLTQPPAASLAHIRHGLRRLQPQPPPPAARRAGACTHSPRAAP